MLRKLRGITAIADISNRPPKDPALQRKLPLNARFSFVAVEIVEDCVVFRANTFVWLAPGYSN